MSDLLRGARELRQKPYRLEVLREIEKGGRSRSWLTDTGLIETAAPPAHVRPTPEGREFLNDVRAKVGAHDALDWTCADEIDFSTL